jgi:hypothetical protein
MPSSESHGQHSSEDIPKSTEYCRHCGESRDHQERECGPHVGLYCNRCGAWITWVRRPALKQSPLRLAQKKGPAPQQPQPQPERACSHCAELDEVLRQMRGINNELRIITRALMNGGKVAHG